MDLNEVKTKMENIAVDVLRGEAADSDAEAAWPKRSLRALQAAGLAGLTVPVEFGGMGGGLLAMVQSSEILAKECASAAMCYGMHCVASAVISAKATPDQVNKWLTPIVKGEHLTTLSLSEPGTGSNFYIPEMKMKNSGHDFELNGEKSFVTSGSFADSYVVSAVAAEAKGAIGEFSLIIVPKNTIGLRWHEPWRGFGMRGNASSNATYSSVKVPGTNILGNQGDQIWYMFEVVAPYFVMAMAGTYLGIATAALEEAISHLKSREHTQSGATLAHNSVIQHRVGQLWSRLESARQLAYHSARLGDAKDPESLPGIFSAKAEVSDCATLVTNEVMSLVGGKGYGENGKLGRLLRDARAAHVMAPTTDMLRTWTGRILLDIPIFSEG